MFILLPQGCINFPVPHHVGGKELHYLNNPQDIKPVSHISGIMLTGSVEITICF